VEKMSKVEHAQTVFLEDQRFTQWYLWVVLVPMFLLFGAGFVYVVLVQSEMLSQPIGLNLDQSFLEFTFGILTALFGAIILFLGVARLRTEVREDGLHIMFYPVHRSFRNIPADTIVECEAVTYRPIREYGGWGLRGEPRGRAYNVKGDKGVRIKLTNGHGLLIGSQQSAKLADSIQELLGRH
jgi:hypothetical protein